jgi:hypothetical protein
MRNGIFDLNVIFERLLRKSMSDELSLMSAIFNKKYINKNCY